MDIIQQQPFGVVVNASSEGQALSSLPSSAFVDLLSQHYLLVLRGFAATEQPEYIQFARQFGSLLAWEFGEVLDLKIQTNSANHIFSNGRVELHWDGAYVAEKPRYNLFQCLAADDVQGGETLFVNAVEVFNRATEQQQRQWLGLTIEYHTEKKAHYGGHLSQPLCVVNPHHQHRVIRYIEAFNEDNQDINPVSVHVRGFSSTESDQFLRDFTGRLYESDVMYRHHWRTGDYLIADNSSLLHGRARFTTTQASRHIKRINIL
jgi:alpha-ketoglutarate-dependent taurine dioxygenase